MSLPVAREALGLSDPGLRLMEFQNAGLVGTWEDR